MNENNISCIFSFSKKPRSFNLIVKNKWKKIWFKCKKAFLSAARPRSLKIALFYWAQNFHQFCEQLGFHLWWVSTFARKWSKSYMDQLLVSDKEKMLNWRGNNYLAFCRFLNFSLNSVVFLVLSSFLHLEANLFLPMPISQPAFALLSATITMTMNHTITKAKKVLLSIFFPWKQWSWSDDIRSPRHQTSAPRRRLATKTQSTHLGLDEISDDNPCLPVDCYALDSCSRFSNLRRLHNWRRVAFLVARWP